MDPRDRLWAELVFPWCEPAALLALRAACRAFRAQLNVSRLWLPLTTEDPRMRYDERLLGWRGVECAMTRERNTRANCDAGHFTRGPVLDAMDVRQVLLVGGRIAVFCYRAVQLFVADTGAQLCSFDIVRYNLHTHAVLDRWIAFAGRDGQLLLLDCVAVRLVDVTPANDERRMVAFTVAGPCVSFRVYRHTDVTVVHVSGRSEGATVVRQVACVQLSHVGDEFALCEDGCSYVLYEFEPLTLQLVDLATGQCKRAFTPRACPIAPVSLYCAYWHCARHSCWVSHSSMRISW